MKKKSGGEMPECLVSDNTCILANKESIDRTDIIKQNFNIIFEKKAELFYLNQMKNSLENQKDKLEFLQQEEQEKQESREEIQKLESEIQTLQKENLESEIEILQKENLELQKGNVEEKTEDKQGKINCLTEIKTSILSEMNEDKEKLKYKKYKEKLKYTKNLICQLKLKKIRDKSIYNYDSEFKYSKAFYTEVDPPIFEPIDVIIDLVPYENVPITDQFNKEINDKIKETFLNYTLTEKIRNNYKKININNDIDIKNNIKENRSKNE